MRGGGEADMARRLSERAGVPTARPQTDGVATFSRQDGEHPRVIPPSAAGGGARTADGPRPPTRGRDGTCSATSWEHGRRDPSAARSADASLPRSHPRAGGGRHGGSARNPGTPCDRANAPPRACPWCAHPPVRGVHRPDSRSDGCRSTRDAPGRAAVTRPRSGRAAVRDSPSRDAGRCAVSGAFLIARDVRRVPNTR